VVGGALAERWNLPVQLVAALRHFPEPDGAPLDTRGLVRCVAAGADAADLVVGSSPGRSLERFWNECGEWFALATNQADALLPEIVERAAVVTAMLDLPAADLITADEVLSRANEALLQLTLEAEQENVRMAAERDQLEVEASTDGLTGLANRRHLDEFLAEHYRVAARYNTPLSVLLLDLDHFKRLNDAYGHQAGDAVLKATASAVKQEVRDADLVARYGGEEFMVVLPATGEDGALECAERVRAAVQRLRVRLGDERVIGVTASVGVSSYRPGAEMSLERLVRDADMALYKAKSSGRNQVKIARVYGGAPHAA
jgi:diguanylate cyclase (GGDEF)-like protein